MDSKIDFVCFFDVTDANPNGDPDVGNLPRTDSQTGHGIVTDVCLKRKIRNYVSNTQGNKPPYEIYFSEGAVLNNQHKKAYDATKQKPDSKLPKDVSKAKALTEFMCKEFFDIRTFGAVMTTGVNCGQVRGPVQLSNARSIDPVSIEEYTITRQSVTNEKDAEKEKTMGQKASVSYGLYKVTGSINPFFAEKTGFSKEDLELFFSALENLFEFDASAARPPGSMVMREIVYFYHSSALGNAYQHKLFDRVNAVRKEGVEYPRSIEDYIISVDEDKLEGVSIVRPFSR